MDIGFNEIVFVFVIIVLVFATAMIAGTGLTMRRRTARPVSGALEILKTRYARGEINREQYEEMKRDLL